MKTIGAIIILVILGLFFGSMFVGAIKDTINDDEQVKEVLDPILPELEEWEQKLEITGIGSLIGVIVLLVPINPGIKGMVIFSDVVGAWMFWPK